MDNNIYQMIIWIIFCGYLGVLLLARLNRAMATTTLEMIKLLDKVYLLGNLSSLDTPSPLGCNNYQVRQLLTEKHTQSECYSDWQPRSK
jgi:hypothetical protein